MTHFEATKSFATRFEAWARAQQDIRAVFIMGSFGQQIEKPWSDIDIAFITKKQQRYIQPYKWLPEIGNVWTGLYMAGEQIGGLPTSSSLFSSFESGICVDFVIMPFRKTQLWSYLLRNPTTRNALFTQHAQDTAYLLKQGVDVLFDHDNIINPLITSLDVLQLHAGKPPSQSELTTMQDDFELGAVQMVRYLMQGRTFAAQTVRDRPMRRSLIQLAQWQAQSKQSIWNDPLKFRDKKIEQWADPEFIQLMPVIFGGYGDENLWHSLRSSMTIFKSMLIDVSESIGYAPDDKVTRITQWVEVQYESWKTTPA